MTFTALSTWERGAQALALLNAALERGYLDLLAEPRTVDEVSAYAGHPADDLVDAFEALGIVTRAGDRVRLDPALAEGLAADSPVSLAAKIARAGLHARQVADVVRGKNGNLTGNDLTVVARSVALQPGPAARAIIEKLHSEIPEVRDLIADGRMLDVGSGVGGYVLTALSLLPGMRATTLELIPEVAAVARRRARELGVADRADIRVMDARDFDEPAAFDAAYWAQPFFPSPTRAATLAMILRCLRPGGILVVQQLDAEPVGDADRAAFTMARLVAQARGVPFARPLAELVTEITGAGFEPVRTLENDLGRHALLRRPA